MNWTVADYTNDDGITWVFDADGRTVAGAYSREVAELIAKAPGLQKEMAAIECGASMPADYPYGLPSWICQRLYTAYIHQARNQKEWDALKRALDERDAALAQVASLTARNARLEKGLEHYADKDETWARIPTEDVMGGQLGSGGYLSIYQSGASGWAVAREALKGEK